MRWHRSHRFGLRVAEQMERAKNADRLNRIGYMHGCARGEVLTMVNRQFGYSSLTAIPSNRFHDVAKWLHKWAPVHQRYKVIDPDYHQTVISRIYGDPPDPVITEEHEAWYQR